MAKTPLIGRRGLLGGAAAAALLAGPLGSRFAQATTKTFRLKAAPARAAIVGSGHPDTEVWAYNSETPGPVLRLRQGERIRIEVENALPQDTTVHWHGLRVPNAMDGVPGLTQPPIAPGAKFVYEFDVSDAGTFWYHPHAHSAEQIERGLAGALIVEDAAPPAVDRDLVWILDDWRLTREAAIAGDFGAMMDASHAGRIGNTVTINGRIPGAIAARANERIRLRLINVANGRVFALEFRGLAPTIVALDGQPVEPHTPDDARVVLGPGQRADLIMDMAVTPGGRTAVIDSFYHQRTYSLVEFAVEGTTRSAPLKDPVRLAANPLPALDLAQADRHAIAFGGGMMDPALGRAQREGRLDAEALRAVRERMAAGHIWTVNGRTVGAHGHERLFAIKRGRTCVLDLDNQTAWDHPIHLHGVVFRVLERDGKPPARTEWRDTEMLRPGQRATVAFAAETAGDWMLHCHVLEHQATGMSGVFRIE